MDSRPHNIGIKALELYIPSQCVDQADLEKFDGVSEGKYTIGLGQTKMSFCDDREDIYSIALTCVSSLLQKYNIDPASIGRLEVGTETLLDKSKSVKTVLMQLFEPSGNTNIEGVDTVNACYGGTNAFFNTINWLESSAWDGRDAIVVAGDIALYSKGGARPTGGAGCVAMLVGPDAPVVVEPGLRGSFIRHVYDFYKADLTSEYPLVDGHYSVKCYTEAIDRCYQNYSAREQKLKGYVNGHANGLTNGHANGHVNGHVNGEVNGEVNGHVNGEGNGEANGHVNGDAYGYTNGDVNGHVNGYTNGHAKENGTHDEEPETPVDRFDYMCFHAPHCKLVAKSYARLLYNDYLEDPENPIFRDVPEEIKDVPYADSISDRNIEKTFVALAKKRFAARVQPSIQVPTMCGNMYCASVYGSLISLLSNVSSDAIQGKRIAIFSYGSGLASSMFSFKIKGSTEEMRQKVDLHARLDARRTVAPEVYDEMCNLRERAHLKRKYQPEGDISTIVPGTYYLTDVDEMFRRSYEIKQ